MLGKAADFYEAEVDDMVAGLSSLMEPIIIVFLGVLIGGIVVSDVPAHLQARPGRLMLCFARDRRRLAGVLGLLVGSFLNVVIYRLPKMLEREWAAECAELAGKPRRRKTPSSTWCVPRSRCRQCGHVIRWYENVPVLSYLVLRGKCSACGTAISLRYPLVELATGALFFFCVQHWGATPAGAAWCAFSAAIVALRHDRLGHHAAAGRHHPALAVGRPDRGRRCAGPMSRWPTPCGARWRATCRFG